VPLPHQTTRLIESTALALPSVRRIGIDCVSVFGLPPVPFIETASELGCQFITLGIPVTLNPENYPEYSLQDPHTQREVKSALREHDLSLKTGEGFILTRDSDPSHFTAHMDTMAELGAETINLVGVDEDLNRTLDGFAALAEMAGARGMQSSLEFVSGLVIGSLEQAVHAVRHVGRRDFKMVIDLLHMARTGGTVAALAAVDPQMIGYLQLCDCTPEPQDPLEEQLYERLPPGAGALPLLEFLSAVPPDLPIGIEVPQRSLAISGLKGKSRLKPCVLALRALLARIDRAKSPDSPARLRVSGELTRLRRTIV
jgi:sugar phosphate isomerase/epimerase